MSLLIDDDTRMLRDAAQRYFSESDSLRSLRRLRNARDLAGVARGLWDGIVELGLAGVLVPEVFGGSGLKAVASTQVSEMMGSTLATGPFLSSAVMAATAITYGGNDRLKAEILPAIASGMIVSLATEESGRHRPTAITTTVRRASTRYALTGRKIAVIDGNIADKFIVAARQEDGDLLLFLVDASAPGITVFSHMGLDSHPAVEIMLNDTPVSETDTICAAKQSAELLDRIYDAGRIHLAAEMLGAAQYAFDQAIDYLKTRVQFGRKIGEFQALQHRAALMFGELEIARSLVLKAASTYDADDPRRQEFASLAKARVGEIAKHVVTEAVQMHGGIGVTDDFDMGLFLKRVKAASERLGDSAFHAERYAQLQGL